MWFLKIFNYLRNSFLSLYYLQTIQICHKFAVFSGGRTWNCQTLTEFFIHKQEQVSKIESRLFLTHFALIWPLSADSHHQHSSRWLLA